MEKQARPADTSDVLEMREGHAHPAPKSVRMYSPGQLCAWMPGARGAATRQRAFATINHPPAAPPFSDDFPHRMLLYENFWLTNVQILGAT